MSKNAEKYSEKDIERFAGLSGIRKKPTPYIGPTDSNGLWTILREPADNCVDIALDGMNKLVHIVYDSEPNRYWVLDEGPGIPVGVKAFEDERGRKEKMSTLYVVTGLTHAGKNFSGDVISRGTHGIGIKATNAMSKEFKVWTFREGQWWAIEYAETKVVKEPYKCKAPKLPHGMKATKGTVVSFVPNLSLFAKGSKIQEKDVEEWCELTSYLVPGLVVKRTNAKGKTTTLVTKGPAEYIEKRLVELKTEKLGKIFTFSSKECDIALAFSGVEGMSVTSYTNGLKNAEGGEHLRAALDALTNSLKAYKGKNEYVPTDLREGLLGLVNYKISAPQFNNQPKDKLIDERVYPVGYPQMLEAWTKFWDANKTMAKQIVERAALLRKRTSEFLKDKKLIKQVKSAHAGLSAKLADVNDRKTPIEDRELYLIEGDGAGGSAKVARYKSFQATFALKGKPLNVMEATKDQVNKNKELASLFAGLGLDLSKSDPMASIRFGKIISLVDPDVDGCHINTLLLTVVWKYMPQLIHQGRVYLVISPEYMGKHKGEIYFGSTVKEVQKLAGTDKIDIRHIKGWGEIDAEDMQPIAFDVTKRRLLRVLPPRDRDGALRFESLMGKNAVYRQKLFGVVTGGDEDEKPAKKAAKAAKDATPSKSVKISYGPASNSDTVKVAAASATKGEKVKASGRKRKVESEPEPAPAKKSRARPSEKIEKPITKSKTKVVRKRA